MHVLDSIRRSHREARRRAFSLVEMIAVLALMAIAAAVVAPALVRYLDIAAAEREEANLEVLRGGLIAYVRDTRSIPGSAEFATNIAAQIGWLAADVSTNSRKMPRLYIVDPTMKVGTNQTPPYTQTIYGSMVPTNARVMIITSLGLDLPGVIPNRLGTNSSLFNSVWSAKDGTMPTGWTYGGNWEDIKVMRIPLAPQFVRVTLNNNATATGRFSLDGTNHIALPSAPWSASFIVGTELHLHGDAGLLQARETLRDPISYTYDKGIWRQKLFSSAPAMRVKGADLQGAYDIFMSGPKNVNAKLGVTQSQVASDMYLYMSNYVYWATNSFASTKKTPVVSMQAAMSTDTTNYLFKAAAQ